MSTNPNMEAIETITVSATSAANITFSNIPQGYTDLKVVVSPRVTSSSTPSLWMDINGTTSGYSGRFISGNGASAGSGTRSYAHIDCGVVNYSTTTSNTFSSHDIYIPNYTSSNNKSISIDVVQESNATTAYMYLLAGLWSNSAAITNLVFTIEDGSNFVQHSSATLYGVYNTITGGAKAFGGYVTEDTNYFYHTFLASGTFTPTQSITADMLVIAGGGGGGWGGGGGGGAGGLLGFNSQALTAQNYTITVGAGGAAGASANYPSDGSCGRQGNNSIFGALTTVVGGGGGYGTTLPSTTTLANGGSGGGESGREVDGQSPGTASPSGQGNNGGAGLRPTPNVNEPSGGGGGAGATGGNATSSVSGAGGNGLSTYSSWGLATNTGQNISGTVWFAGGGGGGNFGRQATTPGVGGNGGGGSASTNGFAGTANTGGGGGGGMGGDALGGAGGSGIVIVRYAK